jgi:hypothetical protein
MYRESIFHNGFRPCLPKAGMNHESGPWVKVMKPVCLPCTMLSSGLAVSRVEGGWVDETGILALTFTLKTFVFKLIGGLKSYDWSSGACNFDHHSRV